MSGKGESIRGISSCPSENPCHVKRGDCHKVSLLMMCLVCGPGTSHNILILACSSVIPVPGNTGSGIL